MERLRLLCSFWNEYRHNSFTRGEDGHIDSSISDPWVQNNAHFPADQVSEEHKGDP